MKVYIKVKVNVERRRGRIHTLDPYMPPLDVVPLYKTLVKMLSVDVEAPDEIVDKNVRKIKDFMEQNPKLIVVPKRLFVRKILKLGRPSQYESVIKLLSDGEYIRVIVYPPDTNRTYIILDTDAKICGNCPLYMTDACPLRETLPKPWDDMCEKGKKSMEGAKELEKGEEK